MTTPEWTEDDRAALLGLLAFESTLCSGCGQPKKTAWHARSEGEYEGVAFVCHGCTAAQGSEAVIHALIDVPPADRVAKYPPFDLQTMTTEPTKRTEG